MYIWFLCKILVPLADSINCIHFMLCLVIKGEHIRKNCGRNKSKYTIHYIREHRAPFIDRRRLATRRFCQKYTYWYTAYYGWIIFCVLHVNWRLRKSWFIYASADYFPESTGLWLTCGIEYFDRTFRQPKVIWKTDLCSFIQECVYVADE